MPGVKNDGPSLKGMEVISGEMWDKSRISSEKHEKYDAIWCKMMHTRWIIIELLFFFVSQLCWMTPTRGYPMIITLYYIGCSKEITCSHGDNVGKSPFVLIVFCQTNHGCSLDAFSHDVLRGNSWVRFASFQAREKKRILRVKRQPEIYITMVPWPHYHMLYRYVLL